MRVSKLQKMYLDTYKAEIKGKIKFSKISGTILVLTTDNQRFLIKQNGDVLELPKKENKNGK